MAKRAGFGNRHNINHELSNINNGIKRGQCDFNKSSFKSLCADVLSNLTNKQNIYFTKRCNESLKIIFKLMKHLGKKYVVLQDQGGWITYEQYAKKNKFEIFYMKTDYGLISPRAFIDFVKTIARDIANHADNTTANADISDLSDVFVVINSMPGYHALQDMKEIYDICSSEGIIVVNDISGSIGYKAVGDFIVGSFGNSKPVNLGKGGFIAYNANSDKMHKLITPLIIEDDSLDFVELYNLLKSINSRQEFYKNMHDDIVCKLNMLNKMHTHDTVNKIIQFENKIIHPHATGINVIVKFDSDELRKVVIKFCDDNNLPYTLCPRYIRVNADAVSIEVKRLNVN